MGEPLKDDEKWDQYEQKRYWLRHDRDQQMRVRLLYRFKLAFLLFVCAAVLAAVWLVVTHVHIP